MLRGENMTALFLSFGLEASGTSSTQVQAIGEARYKACQ